jgi:hypothetical protein
MNFQSLNLNLNRKEIEKEISIPFRPTAESTRAAQVVLACSACYSPGTLPSRLGVRLGLARPECTGQPMPLRRSSARTAAIVARPVMSGGGPNNDKVFTEMALNHDAPT